MMRHKSLSRVVDSIRRCALAAAAFGLTQAANAVTPVTVGSKGNEPLIAISPDGTLYISALQHLYRSTNGGASWKELAGPPEASQLNLNSDSSLSIDPGNRVYFTFDYPYAGTTAVCTSDDHGDSWSCNPAVVPGGTDRMWVLAPSMTAAYEVTNEGLYETAFLKSTDRGQTWTPRALGSGLLEPQTGPLLQKRCSSFVLQPIKIYGNGPADEEVKIYVYDPDATGSVISDIRGTGLKLPTALPSASLGKDGTLWVVSEEANPAGGRQVVVARSADEGAHWKKLPPLPATTTGTATFSWVAAAEPGHVGVLYYYTTENGDPGALGKAVWSAQWAESFDADSSAPSWMVTTVEEKIHSGPICVAADCTGTNRFAGDFITAAFDAAGAAHLTWMRQDDAAGATSIRYARIQSLTTPSGYVPPPCGTIETPTPTPDPNATPANVKLVNISGRVLEQTGDKVGIGGFIITGQKPKRVVVRGIGPSLKAGNQPLSGRLEDPAIELHNGSGGTMANDNWRSSQSSELMKSGIAPLDSREAAIIATLPPGDYTAIVHGRNDATGIGLAEIYDIEPDQKGELGNLSVRADVGVDDNVLIDGVIVRGMAPRRVLFRGIGPELRQRGVTGELKDPTLELHDGNGTLLRRNDSWRKAPNAPEIERSGLAPKDEREPAILMRLAPGAYTSIVRGANGTTGIALAEAYKLD